MTYLESTLRKKYGEDTLHILAAKRNTGSFTYDGIELGAERVTQEIEDTLKALEREGKQITKLSVIGYSLGGLVARYVVGLLYSRDWLSKIEPINFTTFATPHLGVRTPLLGYYNKLWNLLGSRTLSMSGRQLFTIDIFRDTKKPLLAVLADPMSIFVQALRKFKNRSLYANITNDRSAPYYTTYISETDPFTKLDAIDINYNPKYSPNILDDSNPASAKSPSTPEPLYTRLATSSQAIINGLPMTALLTVLYPIGSVVYLVTSGIQSVRSQQRIRLHEAGRAGIGLSSYRIPLMLENARNTVETALAETNASRVESPGSDKPGEKAHPSITANDIMSPASSSQITAFPPLALTQEQLLMIKNLDAIGWKKHRVHIHLDRHSHAAIIARRGLKVHPEGETVARHWLEEDFEI